jgi:hypothetical protein
VAPRDKAPGAQEAYAVLAVFLAMAGLPAPPTPRRYPMSNTLEIPAGRIPDVRDGLLCLLGDAAEQVDAAVDRRDRELHPEWFAPARDLFERACALLDEIGWDGTLQPQATRIDLDEHGRTLQEAVEVVLEVAGVDVEEADVTDRERTARAELSRREEFTKRLAELQALATVARSWTRGVGDAQTEAIRGRSG